jgi:hypothetical protein
LNRRSSGDQETVDTEVKSSKFLRAG